MHAELNLGLQSADWFMDEVLSAGKWREAGLLSVLWARRVGDIDLVPFVLQCSPGQLFTDHRLGDVQEPPKEAGWFPVLRGWRQWWGHNMKARGWKETGSTPWVMTRGLHQGFSILFLIDLYWSIVDLQWCVSFCYTVKWIRHAHPCTHSQF